MPRFRVRFHECLHARADALLELTDALLCADGPTKTLVELPLVIEQTAADRDAVTTWGTWVVDSCRSRLGLGPLPSAIN
ncbi:hypothetical protein [Streptomyces chilikensis]|uniref:Uncharacterized protein n=1 Tax=Streptomyces chilikensis TaxID=1194079 RepID=A0ABV3EIV7_9ACTN